MKNKHIDLLIQREKSRRDYVKQISSARNKILFFLVAVIVFSAAFLLVDTNRLERKSASIDEMITSPESMHKYARITELKHKEADYATIIKDLSSIEGVVSSYPVAAKSFINFFVKDNPQGIEITGFSYNANSGIFNSHVRAKGYNNWTTFVNKIENSTYLTDYEYSGYERDGIQDIYSASFSFRLLNSKGE